MSKRFLSWVMVLTLIVGFTQNQIKPNNIQASGVVTLPSFFPGAVCATGSQPISVTAADLNGDSRPDIAVANNVSHTVSVLLNNNSDAFAPKVDYPTGTTPSSVTAADFNGDFCLDLVVTNGGSNTVSVLLNNGSGTFAPKVDYPTGAGPWSVTAADLNGDSRPDLTIANLNNATVSVLLNNGSGTFAPKVDYPTGTGPSSVTAVDLNGDSRPDIIVANYGSNTVSVLLNNGSGTFAPQVDYPTGMGPWSMTAADLNGDSRSDLIIANLNSAMVSVLLNNGSGTFAPKVDYPTGTGPYSVVAADLNGDSRPDIIVANINNDTVSMLLNNGSGTFAPKVDYPTGKGPSSVTAADLNGDSRPDIIVANINSDTVSVLLNSVPAGGPAMITTSPLPSGKVGVTYSQALVVSGGITPCKWSIQSGVLPAGLSLSEAGIITGTPSVAVGPTTCTFKVTDNIGAFDTRDLTITIFPISVIPAPTVTAIEPTSGPVAGGTAVIITGMGFVSGASVTIGEAAATGVTLVSAISMTAVTPAGTAGAKNVVVTNPDGQSATLVSGFNYTATGVGVDLELLTPSLTIPANSTFVVTVEAQCNGLEILGVELYLNYDPLLITVQSVTPGTTLEFALQNEHDNDLGTLAYSAGKLTQPFPSQNFTVATITFNAKSPLSPTTTALIFNKTPPRETGVTTGTTLVLRNANSLTLNILPTATVDISVILQGGSRPVSSWVVPLTVKFFSPGTDIMTTTPVYTFNLTTAKVGGYAIAQCSGVIPGNYDITALSEHTLLNVKRNVGIATPSTPVNLGTLLEGNANNNDRVNILDFGILATTYGKSKSSAGFNAMADFDRNDIVNIFDFGLLATNYLEMAPVEVP
jgi:hypothetical protein